MELDLMKNEEVLLYDKEHNLGSEPLQIDLLIIRKKPHKTIKNEIGAIFLGHNIVEFKSLDNGMNIDTFYKILAYVCLYKTETVMNLASDVNTKIFEEIVLGGGIMSGALKEMLLPELGELKRQLAESNMELAENRAELARKNAIIAELIRVLAEVGQSMDQEEP